MFIPNLYNTKLYNDDPYPPNADTSVSPYFLTGDASLTMGAIRMRQIRVKNDTCTALQNSNNTFNGSPPPCFGHYTNDNVDREELVVGSGGENERWLYQSGEELEDDGPWQSSKTLAIYESGGFAITLPVGADPAVTKLDELKTSGWIDLGTRALFLDVVNYCPNNDMFLSTRLTFEILPSGVVESR